MIAFKMLNTSSKENDYLISSGFLRIPSVLPLQVCPVCLSKHTKTVISKKTMDQVVIQFQPLHGSDRPKPHFNRQNLFAC